MKKKKPFRKIAMTAGVIVMGVGLFNSFDLEAQTTGGGLCCQKLFEKCWHPVDGTTFADSRWEFDRSFCE